MNTTKKTNAEEANHAEIGTHKNPIRYERIAAGDPNRKQKIRAHLDQFGRDAKSGKILCLSDLMISAGM